MPNMTWKEMEQLDVEEIFHQMVKVLPDELLDQLMDALQGLHIEDEDDHSEARDIMLAFAQNNITFFV